MYQVMYADIETGEVKSFFYYTFSAVIKCIEWLRGRGEFIKVEKIEL